MTKIYATNHNQNMSNLYIGNACLIKDCALERFGARGKDGRPVEAAVRLHGQQQQEVVQRREGGGVPRLAAGCAPRAPMVTSNAEREE